MKKAGLLLGACVVAALTGCKLAVMVPAGGEVQSSSGERNCDGGTTGEYCTFDLTAVALPFRETFTASAKPGAVCMLLFRSSPVSSPLAESLRRSGRFIRLTPREDSGDHASSRSWRPAARTSPRSAVRPPEPGFAASTHVTSATTGAGGKAERPKSSRLLRGPYVKRAGPEGPALFPDR